MDGKVKAYSVTSDHAEASVIVFAQTPAKARALAHTTDWLCSCDYIELKARRQGGIDYLAERYGNNVVLDGSGTDDLRVMRDLGWYPLLGSSETCERCGLFEWDGVPESVITNGICAECHPTPAKEGESE